MLVRTAECIDGQRRDRARLRAGVRLRRDPGTWTLVDDAGHTADATGADLTLRLHTDLAMGIEGNRVRARRMLARRRPRRSARCPGPTAWPPRTTSTTPRRASTATVAFWRDWLGQARIPDHRWRDPIQRSALAIKGLTYMPTGATVAALTTSLPETPGGERNWDYRYTWMRDSTFTLQALHWLNLDGEADEFMQFVADLEVNEDGGLQIMYGIDGRRDLTESTLVHLSGYAGARPVRVGNGAFDQRQNDVFGAALDSILLHTRRSQRLPRRLWPLVAGAGRVRVRGLAGAGPGHLGGPRRAAALRVVQADVLGGARPRRQAGPPPRRRRPAGEVGGDRRRDPHRHRDHGISERGVLRQHYETDSLDASTLLAPLFGFLQGDDERARSSVLAIADELTENGYVLRYRTDETDDGLSGKEGTFLICSFWLVSALADHRRARAGPRPAWSGSCASPRRSGSTPRSSTSRPATTSGTSRRPSPTSP